MVVSSQNLHFEMLAVEEAGYVIARVGLIVGAIAP
jgi:hypothetical protein